MTQWEKLKAAMELADQQWPLIEEIGSSPVYAPDVRRIWGTAYKWGDKLDAKITERLGQPLGAAIYDYMYEEK